MIWAALLPILDKDRQRKSERYRTAERRAAQVARLEDQVKTLQEQLRQARETIELQADRITELTRQLQGRIENAPAYKAQMDALHLARLQAGQESKTERIPNGHKPGARRKYSEETRQQIRERYQAGQSMAQIARELGASKTQIHAIIHETGRTKLCMNCETEQRDLQEHCRT